jgi:23S rRNA (guanosine2251-2'-O)-methyltransferase
MKPELLEDSIYGIHAVEELLKQRIQDVERVYFTADITSSPLFNLLKLCRKERLAYQTVPANKLDMIAGTTKHQGVVAVCSAKSYTPIEELLDTLAAKQTAPLLYIPASIEDPRNLGSLIRTCVAFGVDAMLLERKNTTLLGSTVAKTSAGMLEHLPIVKPKNLEGLLNDLIGQGYSVVGAQEGGAATPEETDFTKPTIIISGGEHRDIPPYLGKLCTTIVGIPIQQTAQSLNVSVAGAILLYECDRQRRAASVR